MNLDAGTQFPQGVPTPALVLPVRVDSSTSFPTSSSAINMVSGYYIHSKDIDLHF